MRTLRNVAFPLLLTFAGPAAAQSNDPFDQPVQGSSQPLPDGVPSESPDAQLEGSANPDSLDTTSDDPDALLTGAGRPIQGHAVNPDAITTGSEDLSDLPAASVVDQPQAPASIPPAPPLPEGCAQPVGDAGWSACLGAVNGQLARARERLDAANGAYSRSITLHVPTGDARLAIIQERDAARADVDALSSTLSAQAAQARSAGASSWVTAPYQPKPQNW